MVGLDLVGRNAYNQPHCSCPAPRVQTRMRGAFLWAGNLGPENLVAGVVVAIDDTSSPPGPPVPRGSPASSTADAAFRPQPHPTADPPPTHRICTAPAPFLTCIGRCSCFLVRLSVCRHPHRTRSTHTRPHRTRRRPICLSADPPHRTLGTAPHQATSSLSIGLLSSGSWWTQAGAGGGGCVVPLIETGTLSIRFPLRISLNWPIGADYSSKAIDGQDE